MTESITNLLNDILKVEGIEEAFSCFLVHHPSTESEKIKIVLWQQELVTSLENASQEQVETALRQYLHTASICSQTKLQLLMELLEYVAKNGTVGARLVCEVIVNFDKLQYSNAHFWVQCFKTVRKIIDSVEYKGVREIMKVILVVLLNEKGKKLAGFCQKTL